METTSILWYRGGSEPLYVTNYDMGGCDLEGKFTCEDLEDYLIPTEAKEVSELSGGWLNLTQYEPTVHEFDESVVDVTKTFTTVWNKHLKLLTTNYVNPLPKLHEVEA